MTNPKKAATCFYLFLALLLLKNVLQDTLLIETGAIFLVLIPICLLAAIAYQVAKERKWAGWIFTVLFPWSVISSLDDVKRAFENGHAFIGIIDLAWMCLIGFGVFFIHIKFLLGLSDSKDSSTKVEKKSQSGSGSAADDLTKLHELLKVGALTQQEFDEQKKRLLKTG